MDEFTNDLTKFMTTRIKENRKIHGFEVYIYGDSSSVKTDNSLKNIGKHPVWYPYDDDKAIFLLRYPGYTCANVHVKKDTKEILKIVVTRLNDGSIFIEDEPNKFEDELNENWKGKIFDIPNVDIDTLFKYTCY